MDLMNSLDADGNGEGESDLGDLERGCGGGRSLSEFMSGRRCKIHRCTIEFNSGVSVNSTSRVTYDEEGRA